MVEQFCVDIAQELHVRFQLLNQKVPQDCPLKFSVSHCSGFSMIPLPQEPSTEMLTCDHHVILLSYLLASSSFAINIHAQEYMYENVFSQVFGKYSSQFPNVIFFTIIQS
jgi:hypothetical protein